METGMTTREIKARLRRFGHSPNPLDIATGQRMTRERLWELLLEEYWQDGYETAKGLRPAGGLAK